MAPWTFVGREMELRRLADAAAGTAGRGLIFGGAPGIGKSRLLREAVARLDRARCALVSAVTNTATAGLPMGSLAPVLPGDQPGGASPVALLRWAADALARQAAGRPVVLAVDDAHLLDPLSAALAHHIARAGNATVLGTLRTGAPVPDQVRALWIDDLVDRVELAPLSRDDIAELLHQVLGGPVEAGSVDRLWDLSQGNALLLRELVRAALASGDITETYGVWRWTGRFDLAPTLTDVVDSRIGQLTAEIREVLELVAFGGPIGLPLLVKATDAGAVELAEERGLIRVARDDRRTYVQLAHPLYGEVVRLRCPLTRVRRLLADLAHLIEATGARRRDDLLRVAVWRLDSDTAGDPGRLLNACRQAFARYEMRLAGRLGRAAVAAHGGFDAAEVLATVLVFDDQPDEALRVLERATETISDDRQRARWLCAHAIATYWGRADESPLGQLPAKAAGLTGTRERSWVQAVEAIMWLHHGEPAAARGLATAVLDQPASAAAARTLAGATMAHLLAAAGTPGRALTTLAETPASERWCAEMPYLRLAVELARGTALLLAGDLAGVDAAAAAEFAVLVGGSDFGLGSGYCAILRAQSARLRGQLGEAGRLAAQACATLAPGQVFAGLAHAERAHVAALAGDAALAAEAMAEADRTHRPTMAILYPWLEQARAWTALAGGDRSGAVDILRRLASRLHADEFYGHEVFAHLDLARIGAAAETVAPLRWLSDVVEGPAVQAVVWYAEATAGRDGAALAVSIGEFEDLGMNLYAAEAAATAVTLLRQVRARSAPMAATSLARLLGLCPAARTPALDVPQPTLTARERQIARLAAAGVSSKDIADQLFLSSRTVDNHLMRVYAKLGVGGRSQLAAALRALPAQPGDE